MNRQKQILFILVIILLLAMVYAYWSTPEQQTVATVNATRLSGPQKRIGESTPGAVDSQRVHLELLEVGKEDYNGSRRNIFSYYQPAPKPQPKPAPLPPPRPVVTPPPPPVVVTPQVRQQLARFTFLGFLVKEDERTVFLSTRDELFVVKKHDYFGDNNQFKVVDVNEEEMTISQSDASGLIEIRLVEEEPLIPSFSPGELKGGGAFFEPPEEVPGAEFQSETGVPGAEPQPETGVPGAERSRQWFKNTQPAHSAQPGSVEGQ